jgi:membrane protein YdbS with pleckstrin-like domain
MHERGLLWRRQDRIETIDIDDVAVEQGPIARMLGVGTVRLTSSDRSTPEFLLAGIEDVRNVATMIDNARRTERRKRGLHIESI